MKKWLAIGMAAWLVLGSLTGCNTKKEKVEADSKNNYESQISKVEIDHKAKLKVWYTQDEEGKFLDEAAEAFQERYGVELELKQQNTVDYMERINKLSQKGKGPDLYLLPHEQLKKAQMAGLAQPASIFTQSFWNANYPDAALLAASLKDGVYGYPLYFDTYYLLYDSNLVAHPPKTFDDILEFTEEFSDQKNNKTIFKWDLSDPYYNYLFLGAYADVFGATGDDTSKLRVNGSETVQAMQYFQELSNYLFGSMTTSTYEAVEKAVTDKKAIFAICKTDMVAQLAKKKTSYRVAEIPDLTDELKSKGLSSTRLAVVNAYSKQADTAEVFATFLSYDYAKEQYDLIGKLCARKGTSIDDENLAGIYEQYENSIPVPKALEMGDFWANMEVAVSNIWNGANVDKQMDLLQNCMNKVLKQ